LGRVGGDQAEDCVRDGVRVVGLDRVLDGRAYGAVLEQRPRCRREGTQPLEGRVDGIRVHHADAVLAEGGQDVGGDLRVWSSRPRAPRTSRPSASGTGRVPRDSRSKGSVTIAVSDV
jgi:hypothetical protein